MADGDRGLRVELYVRSLHPGGAADRQEAVIERLRALDTDGRIDGYQILVWGDRMPGSPAEARTDAGLFALNRAAVFAEWAERNGYSIDGFEHEELDSEYLEESYRTLAVPVMTLAEYEGDDLRFVAPATDDEGTVTVRDRLAQLAGEHSAEVASESLTRAYADPPEGLRLVPRDDDRRNA